MRTPRIGELLVTEGLLTRPELEQALTAQQIYGGRLGTVIVEHGFVHEDDLARLLARQLGVPVVSREDLADVPPDVRALIPQAMAIKYGIVPFRYHEARNRVSVAMADPTNLQLGDEIQFALGRGTEFFACPEIVLGRALEKYYGVPRKLRYIRVALGDSPRPRAVETGSEPKAKAEPDATKRDGILGLLIQAPTKERAIECVLDWLATFGDQAAFLAACGPTLAAWSVRGPGTSNTEGLRETCRLQDSPTACSAFLSQGPSGTTLSTSDPLRAGLEGLGVDCAGRVMVAPLFVHDQPFGLFVVSRLRTGVTVDVTLVSELIRRLSLRLQALHLMEMVAAPLGPAS